MLEWNVFESLGGEKKSIMNEFMQIYPANIFTINIILICVVLP